MFYEKSAVPSYRGYQIKSVAHLLQTFIFAMGVIAKTHYLKTTAI
jgi:hypothetical protein